MREFSTLSNDASSAMKICGEAGPTVNIKDKMVKGYLRDDEGSSKAYWNSDDLRALATGMNEVADWLDERAKQ